MSRSTQPWKCLVLLLILSGLLGCVRVRPLSELRREVGTGQLVDVGGQRVYVEATGQGEPVLLVHGFGASSYSWRKVLPELAREFRVVALDLNGFGLTDRPPGREAYTREGQVALILATLDALGIERAHVVGHSYGGALAMTLAALHPRRVQSMTLVDAAAVDYPIRRRNWLRALPPLTWTYVRGLGLRRSFIRRFFRKAYHNDSLVTDELVDAYRERLRVQGVSRSFRQLTRPRNGSSPPEIRYEELAVPSLVIWGVHDKLVTLGKGRRYAALLPDHRFVTVEAAGHSPMEESPREFLTALLPFLREMSDRR